MTFIQMTAQDTEVIKVENFRNVNVIGRIDVEMQQSDEAPSIELNYEGIEREKISIKVEDNTLTIKLVSTLSYENIRVLVKIQYNEISKVNTYSSASVGSNEIIKCDKISLSAESGSEIILKLDAGEINSESVTGGILTLSGTAVKHTSKITTKSTLSAGNLICKEYDIEVKSKGIAKINVTAIIVARATTGGFITYSGNPGKSSVDATLGGKISTTDLY